MYIFNLCLYLFKNTHSASTNVSLSMICYHRDIKCLEYIFDKFPKDRINVLATDKYGRNGLHLAICSNINNDKE